MAVFTEESARANVRNQDGKRVFFLAEGDHLTPSAREWLRKERIEILPAEQLKKTEHRLLNGAVLLEKPEHMTHLRTGILVPKNHPRIRFRGQIDQLEAELLLAGHYAASQGDHDGAKQMKELLDTTRTIIRCDVLEEAVKVTTLCGYTMEQLRTQSHLPQKYFGQAHFMPEATDSQWLLRLNLIRTHIRQAELSACDAFQDRDGAISRDDMIRLLNRMSSLVWILMIRRKKEESHGT